MNGLLRGGHAWLTSSRGSSPRLECGALLRRKPTFPFYPLGVRLGDAWPERGGEVRWMRWLRSTQHGSALRGRPGPDGSRVRTKPRGGLVVAVLLSSCAASTTSTDRAVTHLHDRDDEFVDLMRPSGCGTRRWVARQALDYRSELLPSALLVQAGRLVSASSTVTFVDAVDSGCSEAGPACRAVPRLEDEREGTWSVYDSGGRLRLKGYYRDGRRDGHWELYDASGRVMVKRYYWEGSVSQETDRGSYLEAYCRLPAVSAPDDPECRGSPAPTRGPPVEGGTETGRRR